MAEPVGIAPTSVNTDLVFKTSATSFYRPRLQDLNWLPDVDSHHDDPINSRTCYFDIIREWYSRQDFRLRLID
jgi:hypothetical protein